MTKSPTRMRKQINGRRCERTFNGNRIDAILVTHSGDPGEKLLGILTIWGLPRLHKAVDLKKKMGGV